MTDGRTGLSADSYLLEAFSGAISAKQYVVSAFTEDYNTISTQFHDIKLRYKVYHYETGARFTKYLTTILRLSYDNAKVMIDLRRTSNLQNMLQ